MESFRPSRWRNPATWYTLLGFGLLGGSLYMPWLAASRTARVEIRAEQLAHWLLEATRRCPPPSNPAEVEHLVACFYMLADCRGAWTRDLELVEPPPPGAIVCFRNKHYLIQLTESPPPSTERFAEDRLPALEVTAWPLSAVGPGHCAFFYPENAERAYTRNLRSEYAGIDKRPQPGRSHRRPGASSRRLDTYTSDDDERWIYY